MNLALIPLFASSLLSVTTVFPEAAEPGTSFTFVVAGVDIDAGSTVTVGGVGLSDLQVYPPRALIGTLDTTGLVDGTYDVVLTRGDATEATLADGFEVLTGAVPNDEVQLLAVVPPTAIVGRLTEYTVIGANFDVGTTVAFEEFRGPTIEPLALLNENVGTASVILVAGTVSVSVERPDTSSATLDDTLQIVTAVSDGTPVQPQPIDDGGCAATGVSLWALLAPLVLLRRRSRG